MISKEFSPALTFPIPFLHTFLLREKQAFRSFYNATSLSTSLSHTYFRIHKAQKNRGFGRKKNLSKRSQFKILNMSCNHLPKIGRDGPLYFWLGGGGNFFLQKYFFVTKSFGDLRMNFISLAWNIFLALCCYAQFLFLLKSYVGNFFRICPATPIKNKMYRPE